MDYSVSYLILCADNRAAKSYDFGYYGDGYNGSDDITSMTEYAKKNIDPEHEKESEDYCDGEKRYYWHNPIDLDGDESNGKESGKGITEMSNNNPKWTFSGGRDPDRYREYQREYQRRWREANREKYRAYQKAYQSAYRRETTEVGGERK